MIDKNLKIQIVNELYKHIEQPDKIEINLWQFYVIIVIIICLSIITIRYIYVIFVGIRDIIRRIKAILADDDDVINKKKKNKKKKKIIIPIVENNSQVPSEVPINEQANKKDKETKKNVKKYKKIGDMPVKKLIIAVEKLTLKEKKKRNDKFMKEKYKETEWDVFMVAVMILALCVWLDLITLNLINL